MSIALTVLAIFAYLFIGGTIAKTMYDTRANRCRKCSAIRKEDENPKLKSYERTTCYRDHGPCAIISGVFWPLAAPMFAGSVTSSYITSSESRRDRREKRKQADHERKMAQLEAQRVMTMESVKFLVENGIQADVPGLFDVNGGKS